MANAKGVDVSHWQDLGDWSTSGLSFAVVKSTEGGVKDSMYDSHVAKASRAGLVVMAYAFNRADLPIEYQVDAFIRHAGDVAGYFIDVEEEGIAGRQRFTPSEARQFMALFRSKTRKRIGLYISQSPYVSLDYAASVPDYLWIAKWSTTPPSVRWDFWQYRGSPLDLDQFHGDAAALDRFVDIPIAPESDTDMGLDIELFVTKDKDPYDNLYTAKLNSGSLLRVSDGAHVSLPAGTDLGIVQSGQYNGSAIFALNHLGKQHIVARSNCTSAALPRPTDTSPFTQSDVDQAKADGAKAQLAADTATIDAAHDAAAAAQTAAADAQAAYAELSANVDAKVEEAVKPIRDRLQSAAKSAKDLIDLASTPIDPAA